MKILNLYAGLGGNRKLWGEEHEITAIEYDFETANEYKKSFPNDTIIVTDAHQYLLENYMNYDFIWSSPPCPTHSDIRRCGVQKGQYEALYPDMALYQEIILLMNFAPKDCKWVVENVKPYYNYLIPPKKILHRHPFWSNFNIYDKDFIDTRKHSKINGTECIYGFDIKNSNIQDKRKALRNMVNPDLGKYILDCAMAVKAELNNDQLTLF